MGHHRIPRPRQILGILFRMSDVRIFHLFPIFMDFECFIAVSKVEEYLSLAYGGLKLFLRQVEPFLEGTMFKAPVAVINSLIDLSEVRSSSELITVVTDTGLFQAIVDNNSAMKVLVVQLTNRIKDMSEACQHARSDEAKKRIDDFIRYGLPFG